MKNNKLNVKRYGIFYKAFGTWKGPYMGLTYTKHQTQRNPFLLDLMYFKNNVLKSRVKVLPVG